MLQWFMINTKKWLNLEQTSHFLLHFVTLSYAIVSFTKHIENWISLYYHNFQFIVWE